MARVSFRDQVLQAREQAILASVNRLLADKGFDAMTLEAVAADVGIAKASLYRHFSSKEELAAAAMIKVLDEALAHMDVLAADPAATPIQRLKALVRWTMRVQLAGAMPLLPAQNSALRAALMNHGDYMQRLTRLSEQLGAWIAQARAAGELGSALPPEVVLYMLFARACDPVLALLKFGGQYTDDQIIELLLSACFDGLGASAAR